MSFSAQLLRAHDQWIGRTDYIRIRDCAEHCAPSLISQKQHTFVFDTIQTFDYGKCVRTMDTEANKIELLEPIDGVLTKMGGKTTT